MTQPPRGWIQEALERHEGPLLQYARRFTGDLDRARDVVQEAFLRLCKQPRETVEGRVREWLYTVCRNAAMDLHRKETGMKMREQEVVRTKPPDNLPPDVAAEADEEQTKAVELLGSLPPRQQEALRLRFQGGLSYKEIAKVTDTSIGNVGYLIHMGLMKLREEMRVTQMPATGEGRMVTG